MFTASIFPHFIQHFFVTMEFCDYFVVFEDDPYCAAIIMYASFRPVRIPPVVNTLPCIPADPITCDKTDQSRFLRHVLEIEPCGRCCSRMHIAPVQTLRYRSSTPVILYRLYAGKVHVAARHVRQIAQRWMGGRGGRESRKQSDWSDNMGA
jgi:hypothetical protein